MSCSDLWWSSIPWSSALRPKIVVVPLRPGIGCVRGQGGGSFGLFGWFVQSLTTQAFHGPVRFGFAWLVWFCWPRRESFSFSGLGESAAAIFQLTLRWTEQLLDRNQRSATGGAGRRIAPFQPPNFGKPRRGEKAQHSKRLQPSCFVCRGEEVSARESLNFHLLLKLLCEAPVWFFPLREKPATVLYCMSRAGIFLGILGFCFGVCVWVRSDSLIFSSYLLFSHLPCGHSVC